MSILKDPNGMHLYVDLTGDEVKVLEEVKIRRQLEYGGKLENTSTLIRALLREECEIRQILQGGIFEPAKIE